MQIIFMIILVHLQIAHVNPGLAIARVVNTPCDLWDEPPSRHRNRLFCNQGLKVPTAFYVPSSPCLNTAKAGKSMGFDPDSDPKTSKICRVF